MLISQWNIALDGLAMIRVVCLVLTMICLVRVAKQACSFTQLSQYI